MLAGELVPVDIATSDQDESVGRAKGGVVG